MLNEERILLRPPVDSAASSHTLPLWIIDDRVGCVKPA